MENITVGHEKYDLDYLDNSKTKNISQTFWLSDYDQRIKNIGFATESFYSKVKLSIEILMEQIKIIVVDNRCLKFDKNHYI